MGFGALLDVSWKGWTALAVFALQNGLAILLMRYSKLHDKPYSSQVAVLMQELACKLPISAVFYAMECGGAPQALRSLMIDLRQRPIEWLQLAVPALLYTVQNTMLYVGMANVEAAIGQVTYQSKILWTALFSVLILGKRLSSNQWLSLVVLACGVLAVQAMEAPKAVGKGSKGKHHHEGRAASLEAAQAAGNPVKGVSALVLAAVCTAFASVYFEKMLKGASKPSLWLRNIQLATYSSVIAAVGILLADDPVIAADGWLAGFSALTWTCVLMQSLGGLLVAVTIKYADNILRGFAQGLALIIGAVGSYLLFDFHLSLTFCFGVLLVIVAIFMYGSPMQSPQELCEALCGVTRRDGEDGARLVGVEDEAAAKESPRGRGSGTPSAPTITAAEPAPLAATANTDAEASAAAPGGKE